MKSPKSLYFLARYGRGWCNFILMPRRRKPSVTEAFIENLWTPMAAPAGMGSGVKPSAKSYLSVHRKTDWARTRGVKVRKCSNFKICKQCLQTSSAYLPSEPELRPSIPLRDFVLQTPWGYSPPNPNSRRRYW